MKKTITLSFLLLFSICIKAQNNNDDFQNFRKGVLEGYQGFRKNILDDYDKFLNGIWEDYEIFAGKKSNPKPKPETQPIVKKDEPAPIPQQVEPEVIIPATPVIEETPRAPKPVVAQPTNLVTFEWCGMPFKLPDASIANNLTGVEKEDLINYLEIVKNSKLDKEVMPQLEILTNGIKLSDWCLYLLIESYVKKIKANSDTNTRNFICWYMMVKSGFDVRITLNDDKLFYLIPFQQQIYARNYLLINNVPYYLYGEGDAENSRGFYTPKIPDATGKYVNAVLTRPLNIQYRAKTFTHSYAGRTLSVDINENLIRVMSKFPQMPIPSYAVSEGDSKARAQLLNQMKQFVSGMSETEAANFILKFIQSFEYATDHQQFGYEKPFFLEESLYYPKCDCEDRSILYHYLVVQLLGRDVHLLHYPNHECTAVNFSHDLNGDSYLYSGKQYIICDPTYIGASIGMCMPNFKKVKPEVELAK